MIVQNRARAVWQAHHEQASSVGRLSQERLSRSEGTTKDTSRGDSVALGSPHTAGRCECSVSHQGPCGVAWMQAWRGTTKVVSLVPLYVPSFGEARLRAQVSATPRGP